MKRILLLAPLLFLNLLLSAQEATTEESKPEVTRFSHSEEPCPAFLIDTDLENCRVSFETEYKEEFKIRVIDYWGTSVKIFPHLSSGSSVDISEFKNQVVTVNILNHENNRLLSSQVVNLKRRNYWK